MYRPFDLLARAACLSVALLLPLGAGAAPPAEFTWDDLLPPALRALEEDALKLQDKYFALTPEERSGYEAVARELSVRKRLESEGLTEDKLSPDEREVLGAGASARYPEAEAFWGKLEVAQAELEAMGAMVDPTIDGKRIRIPGYVLPLESDGTKVREFLLVPYVGACIHTPPPPANQMVFVRTSTSFESKGLFTPVWVEGTLSASGGRFDLSLVDGQAPVDAGYSLEATKVELYNN